jgi:hypothetical protein
VGRGESVELRLAALERSDYRRRVDDADADPEDLVGNSLGGDTDLARQIHAIAREHACNPAAGVPQRCQLARAGEREGGALGRLEQRSDRGDAERELVLDRLLPSQVLLAVDLERLDGGEGGLAVRWQLGERLVEPARLPVHEMEKPHPHLEAGLGAATEQALGLHAADRR